MTHPQGTKKSLLTRFTFLHPHHNTNSATMAATAFLAAIDLQNYPAGSQLPKEIAYAGGIFAIITAGTLENAFQLLKDTVGRHEVYLEVSNVQSQEDVVALLDAGAAKVFVSATQASGFEQVANLDLTRVVYCPSGAAGDAMSALEGTPYGLYLQNVTNAEVVGQILRELGKHQPPVFVSKAAMTEQDAIALCRQGATPIVSATNLTLAAESVSEQIRVSSLLLSQAKSDRPDGLFSTAVTDERGVLLGIVYSNEESVAESLRSGRGVYHSRKRGLWRKGDTSGDWQELIRIRLDCDGDCLQFVVRQQGDGFCHLKRATCFGQYTGLSKLEKTLQSRKRSAPEGSYTARLFNDSKMLNAKIMEEAAEACEATKKDHFASEAADVSTLR